MLRGFKPQQMHHVAGNEYLAAGLIHLERAEELASHFGDLAEAGRFLQGLAVLLLHGLTQHVDLLNARAGQVHGFLRRHGANLFGQAGNWARSAPCDERCARAC